MMKYILLGIELIIFSGFTWALIMWFAKRNEVKRWELQYIKIGALFFTILHLLAVFICPLPNTVLIIIGMIILGLSFILFWWTVSIFKSKPPAIAFSESIVTSFKSEGPYKIVRHPFYVSYSLTWLGGTIATGCWLLLLSVLVMGYIYWKAAREEEKEWLVSADAEAYRRYRSKTGMFFPNPLKLWKTRKE